MTEDKLTSNRCCCRALADLAAIPMGGNGLDQLVRSSFKTTVKHSDLWWLHIATCLVCRQDWMIAQDERIYDNYYLKRINEEVLRDIVEFDLWPDDFLTYQQVLKLGREKNVSWTFEDALSPALLTTVKDLRRERSDITETEIAYLLAIPVSQVTDLLR